MIKCSVIVSLVDDVTVYGFDFFHENEERPFRREEDVFDNEEAANELAGLINEGDVEEIHLDDILEDAVN